MDGKKVVQASPEASENGLEIQTRFFVVLGCLWTPFGTLFGAFWTSWGPSGLPQGHFGLPQAVFLAAFASFGPPRTCRDFDENFRELAEISPRTCRSSAENLPSFRRESAKNQPRTCRMNPRQNCLSRCAFFELTAFSDKRFNKIAGNKSGAAVSPLGGLRLNSLRNWF